MESKMIKVKVRIRDFELQESVNVCKYLMKSRSYLVVYGFNKMFKNVAREKIVSNCRCIKRYLHCNTYFTTVCLPYGVYIAIKKLANKIGYSLNVVINYSLMYILRLIKISKKVRDELLHKYEEYDSEVKKTFAIYQLIYGYSRRLKKT